MKNIKQAIIVFVILLGFSQIGHAQNRTILNEARRVTGDEFTFSARTPKGASVYGVSKPSAVMLQSIDQGLTDLFAVAKKNGYSKRLKYAEYTIFIAKADRTKNGDGNYSPDIAVGAGQYAGSIYDKGGYIYAAGMVLTLNPMAFVIAEHTKEYNRVSDVVRYEGEHLVLYHNDRKRYLETVDHSKGGGHPILK
jgi:hypothetical protein